MPVRTAFYDSLCGTFLYCAFVGFGPSIVALLIQEQFSGFRVEGVYRFLLLIRSSVLAMLFASGCSPEAYHLVFSDVGVVHGAGWTDINIRLPAYLSMAVLVGLSYL